MNSPVPGLRGGTVLVGSPVLAGSMVHPAMPCRLRLLITSSFVCPKLRVRLFGGDQRRRTGETAEAAVRVPQIGHRSASARRVEAKPQRVDQAELGVGRVPQQEIGQAFLATGANEQIDVVAALGSGA